MKSIKAVFGANIRLYRKKQQFSQEQLAERLGITPKHMSSIETGANFVSVELLEKLTQHLQVSASALFYSEDNELQNDDNLLSQIDNIINKECEKTSSSIKMQIRYLSGQ